MLMRSCKERRAYFGAGAVCTCSTGLARGAGATGGSCEAVAPVPPVGPVKPARDNATQRYQAEA